MNLVVNGKEIETEAASLKDLAEELGFDRNGKGVAIAVNDDVVPKEEWEDRILSDEDTIEIIRAIRGG